MVDFISSAVLGGILYDLLKQQVVLTTEQLRHKLSKWVIDDTLSARIIEQVQLLPKPEKATEADFIQAIERSPSWQLLLKEIKPIARTAVQHNAGVISENISGGSFVGSQTIHGNHISIQGDYHAAPTKKS